MNEVCAGQTIQGYNICILKFFLFDHLRPDLDTLFTLSRSAVTSRLLRIDDIYEFWL